MALVVQKYGGSSVADSASLKRVARRIVRTREAGHDVVVVVSAMGDTTDDLLDLTTDISQRPDPRELDMLLTSGERISMSLLAMAVRELGRPAVSLTGVQAGLRTTHDFGKAKITGIEPKRIRAALEAGRIPIIAGFQGASAEEDITTLGRGGSDTTAVAVAAAVDADVCEINTDVDGLYSADPRVVPSAQQMPVLSTQEALELAAHGAKILHLRSVEFARRFGVPLHVRSSFADRPGTWVIDDLAAIPEYARTEHEESLVEEPVIRGVTHSDDLCKITVVNVPDVAGRAATIFSVLSKAVSTVDMIGQTHTAVDTGHIDFSFALPLDDGRKAVAALREAQAQLGFSDVTFTDEVGKLSVVGAGMRSNAEVSAELFHALSEAGVTVHLISTSEIRVSVVVEGGQLEEATRAAHRAFGLDTEAEAVVYAGTGR
ncbi:MAG TPA: aspartate kinase [Segeticoccus sp.]|uniref:aspartate kinase n=1 Tax=Segeticoccus sp. TaxID=2706531 RepID=UPI002D807DF7|nr:aspartate kinase [Segeticoccus sp.]HET8599858.1 aspartate kinase [Segeticoccus sp.]